ncbi:MAG: Gfo/Idh/MocA family oxidoreductase [Planctomycetota bacterium]
MSSARWSACMAACFVVWVVSWCSPSVADDAIDRNSAEPLRLAVIGLVHGHVEGVLWAARDRNDIEIVGVFDPSRALFDKFGARYGLDPSIYFDDLDSMLDRTRPEAASVMTSIAGHLEAAEACAPRGVHMLVEKPLAFSNEDAEAMASLAREHGVLLLTNYETSWYASVRTAARLARETGPITRAVFRHGHKGPIEIGCSPEFLEWLTDPEDNGGGAIVDFGCYGAGIMTWLMDNRLPDTVSASTNTLKPDLYPDVDDDATIVLTYEPINEPGLPPVEGATAVIQASWAWTHDNKDTDLHTIGGSYHAAKWDALEFRSPDGDRSARVVDGRPGHLANEWSYLRAVVRGECEIDPLSSLENNLAVVRILDAARASARTGQAVRLTD